MFNTKTFFPTFVFLLVVLLRGTTAQTSDALCSAAYNWADNSLGQSPCVVAAFLLRQCSVSEIDIPVLPPGDHYDPGDSSSCNCNTVVYSLISACADCQGRMYDSWSAWSVNCTNVFHSSFPDAIPSGTAVPAWAYLDVLSSNNYSAAQAMADVDAPESTPPAAATVTSPQTTTIFTYTPTASPTAASSHSVNVGIIVGGVIGGLVVLGLVGGGIAWLVLRKKRDSRAGGIYEDRIQPMASPPPNSMQTAFSLPSSQAPSIPPPKLYDPSDPSTYPDAGMAAPTDWRYAPPLPRTDSAPTAGFRSQYSGTPQV
jgi:hypothetical protein